MALCFIPCVCVRELCNMVNISRQVVMKALVIITLLHQLLSLSQAQSDDQVKALLAIKDAVGGASPNLLTSWIALGGPCLDKWAGVTCDKTNKIIALNLSASSLQGRLPIYAFANLTSLISLDFSYNNLESPLPDLGQLKSLHDLNFSSNELKENFPTSLLKLTNLVELRLSNNFLEGIIPLEISNLRLLEQLWLGNNTLFGELPYTLSSLTRLQTLTAWGMNLNMDLPADWGLWVNITYINLHSSNIRGSLPPEWGQNFTKLQRLSLYNNYLIGRIPESWTGMTSLQEFRFKLNELIGGVPAQLLAQLQRNNAFVDFACNYLTGPYPTIFNDTVWKGNCFDNVPDHDDKCDSTEIFIPAGRVLLCADFFNGSSPGRTQSSPSSKAAISGAQSISKGAISGIIISLIVAVCGILGLACWARPGVSNNRRHRRGDQEKDDWMVPQGIRRFTYKEITKVTKSFDTSCKIGEGGFGKVYMAQLEDGKRVAIKRASDLSFQGTKEFHNEITLLSRLHHRHLVRLEGFCDDRDEQILVYEYMSNGNLHRHLLDKHASILNWYRRLEIALAIAQGLDYLHTFARPPVIHRDIKPSNILLDDNMIAKVSDFGISKANPEVETHVSTRPAGTVGYWDPEYFVRCQLTTASDVYGYGVVLLELITGQPANDHKRLEDYNLVAWVKPRFVTNGIHAIIDQRLGPNFPAEQYEEVAHLALGCTAFERCDRPTMQTVVSTLEKVLSSLVPPPEHLMPLSFPSSSPLIKGKNSNLQSCETERVIEFEFTYSAVEPR